MCLRNSTGTIFFLICFNQLHWKFERTFINSLFMKSLNNATFTTFLWRICFWYEIPRKEFVISIETFFLTRFLSFCTINIIFYIFVMHLYSLSSQNHFQTLFAFLQYFRFPRPGSQPPSPTASSYGSDDEEDERHRLYSEWGSNWRPHWGITTSFYMVFMNVLSKFYSL